MMLKIADRDLVIEIEFVRRAKPGFDLVDLVMTYQQNGRLGQETAKRALVGTLKLRNRRLETQFRRDKTRLNPDIAARHAVE